MILNKYYICIAMDSTLTDRTVSATEISTTLLENRFWAFSRSAPVIQKLKSKDIIIFYVGGKGRHYFIASAEVQSSIKEANSLQLNILDKLGLSFLSFTVELYNVKKFEAPIKIIPLINELDFIKDKKNYGLALRLPLREISQEDFLKIDNAQNRH